MILFAVKIFTLASPIIELLDRRRCQFTFAPGDPKAEETHRGQGPFVGFASSEFIVHKAMFNSRNHVRGLSIVQIQAT